MLNRLRPDTVRGRLRAASGAVGVLLVLIGALGWWSSHRLAATIRDTLGAVRQQAALSSRFAGLIALEAQAAERYLEMRDPAARDEFRRLGEEAHEIDRRMRRDVSQSAAEVALIARIDAELSSIESRYARAHRLMDLGRAGEARAEAERVAAPLRGTLADVEQLGVLTAGKVADVSMQLQQETQRQGWQFVALLLSAVLIAMSAGRLVAGGIARPLESLVAHAHRLSEGNLTARTRPEHLPGEFRILAVAMNQATTSLENLAAAEAALRQAEKFSALGQLVSGVAREINAPLAAAMLEVEAQLAGETDPTRRRALSEALGGLARVRRIVRDLLSFVKDRRAASEPVPPAALVEGALRAVAGPLAEWGTRVERHVSARLPLLLVDRAGIEQALSNLILNAAQAAGAGGAVRVTVRASEGGYEFSVADSGAGVPEDLLPRIFEPFFSAGDEGRGAGLGLSAALGIVEQHGGMLRVANLAPGGARFTMTLPDAGAPGQR